MLFLWNVDVIDTGELKKGVMAMPIFLMPLKRYFDFHGRSTRKEYWSYALFQLVVWILIFLSGEAGYLWGALWVLVTAIPNLAVLIRRLHDGDYSGFWIFIGCIPVIGGIWLFILLVQRSQVRVQAPNLSLAEAKAGVNRFGKPQKA